MRTITIFVSCLLLAFTLQAQEFYVEGKKVTGVYKANGKSKGQIYQAIIDQLSEDQEESDLSFEILDKENGLIVANGRKIVPYRNIGKILYPKRGQMAELLDAEFSHKIEVQVEDEIFLISYSITEMTHEIYNQEELFYNCVNFEDLDKEELQKYNASMDRFLKLNFMFKNKRTLFLENSGSQFEDVSNTLRNNAEVTLKRLSEGV